MLLQITTRAGENMDLIQQFVFAKLAKETFLAVQLEQPKTWTKPRDSSKSKFPPSVNKLYENTEEVLLH